MKTLKNLFAINSDTEKAAEELKDKFVQLLKNENIRGFNLLALFFKKRGICNFESIQERFWGIIFEQEIIPQMNKIYSKFTRSLPGLWVMLQMPGVVSHAFLILEMKKAASGYHLKIIDSNRPKLTREIDYQYGDHSLELGSTPFVPYVGFQNDFKKINFAIQRFCQK